MSILFTNEIYNAIINELTQAEKSVQIITAYCKENTFQHFLSAINTSITDKRLMIRFRMDDVVKGSSDFDVLKLALADGWKVFIRFDLHAKTYIVDNKRGIVGSANLTGSGLGVGRAGSMEMAAFVDVDSGDIEKINRLYEDAVEVDDALITKMNKQLENVDRSIEGVAYKWDKSISDMFNPHIDTLFSYELPDDFVIENGQYFAFMDEMFNGDIAALKEAFRWSNSYNWLLTVLRENGNCMYFGELTAKLHDALVSDPKPYRRDVKQMLSNLLKLIETLGMEEIIIDRPNYSQRVRLLES